MIRIGVDTGGTFTDIAVLDEASGAYRIAKVPSSPEDPARAILEGIAWLAGDNVDAVSVVIHGTTVATNAILEGRGARTALLTTRGFRDVLHIQRQERPSLYNIREYRTPALIPRQHRYEVHERMLHDGSELQAIDWDALEPVIKSLAAGQIESVAVGLLHSHANPDHERAVADALQKRLPSICVTLSHALSREHGEYERFSTCAMNAYVQPVMRAYLESLTRGLQAMRITAPLFVMKSNGGVMRAAEAGQQCVHTVLSGPAGGVRAGQGLAHRMPGENVITADMGGTSFDVAVIISGDPAVSRDAQIGGRSISVPMLDIHTIGAGGGSVASVDAGGALRVGPESAGAQPGPACYGLGGMRPTVTDANLVLGRLSSASTLAGTLTLKLPAAQRAIQQHVADPLDIDLITAAEGILRVVNAAMTRAIRKLTVEQGLDPRSFTLCPFGGAGPLHAVDLARELGLSRVLVPATPGVFSAMGLLQSDLREDRVRTLVALLGADALETARIYCEDMRAELSEVLGGQGRDVSFSARLGVRYVGQSYEIPVPFDISVNGDAEIASVFHEEHERLHGYARKESPVELASVWMHGIGRLAAVQLTHPAGASAAAEPRPRDVVFNGQIFSTDVLAPLALIPGVEHQGPVVIEQLDTTILVGPGDGITRLEDGNFLIRLAEGAGA